MILLIVEAFLKSLTFGAQPKLLSANNMKADNTSNLSLERSRILPTTSRLTQSDLLGKKSRYVIYGKDGLSSRKK
jgi:hypothetical protein